MPDTTIDFSAVARPTAEARGLPNPCYVDRDYFLRERERVFARGWACVGVASEVPDIGDYRPVDLMGMPLLLLRDRERRLRAFHNVCSHRGVALVEAPGSGPVLRCPYHSWAYDLSGRLVRTPDFGGPGVNEVPDIDRGELGLREIRTGQWLDFVFVNVSGDAEPLEEWLSPLMRLWAHYDLAQLRHGGSADFTIRANWKLATENTMEFYHLPWVHQVLNSYSPTHAHYHCNAGDRFLGTATRDYRPSIASGRSLPKFPGLTPEQELVGEYPVVFPNLWLGVQVDHFFAMVVYPRAPDLTEERLHLYFVGEEAMGPDHAALRQEIVERWRAINLEDIAITERMQGGRQSPAFDGGRMSPVQDFAIHHFMRMVAARVAD